MAWSVEMKTIQLKVRSQIDTLVILDRAIDLVSPLPIQLTYE